LLRLDRIAVPIWHVKKSLAFYRDFLGLALVDAYDGDDWGGHAWLMMIFGLSDQRELALVYIKGAKKPPASKLPKDARHVSLAETGALDRWRVKLTKAKIAHWEEEHGDRRSIFFEDPNGNVLQLISPPSTAALEENADALKIVKRWAREAKS
jgi:catechol 2,3-dioxygenase-like lactoylglutathione lyase family enzyme